LAERRKIAAPNRRQKRLDNQNSKMPLLSGQKRKIRVEVCDFHRCKSYRIPHTSLYRFTTSLEKVAKEACQKDLRVYEECRLPDSDYFRMRRAHGQIKRIVFLE